MDDDDFDYGPFWYELGYAGSFIEYKEEEEEKAPIGFRRVAKDGDHHIGDTDGKAS